MADIVRLVGHGMGGRPAEKLMARLGMPISDDTILRHVKCNIPSSTDNKDVRVVGIDDWSWRKSSHYGTIMVDLERRSVIDVLDDRSVANVKAWLQERAHIEIVSRDRCGLYSQAALPSCWGLRSRLGGGDESAIRHAAPERLPFSARDHRLRGLVLPSLRPEHGGC